MFRLITLIQTGGWMMIPILLASVVTVALIFECAWTLGKSRKRFEAFLMNPQGFQPINPGERPDPVSTLIAYRLANPRSSAEEVRAYSEVAFGPVDRKVGWLQVLAAIAPLLGLLGTVSGMIQNFGLVASTRPTNPLAQLSAGISEALVATAGGLLVAVVAALGHHWLSNRADALLLSAQGVVTGHEPERPTKPRRSIEEANFGS
ncbi:Biopolymer transport protein ExbB [compost metagenome]